MTPLKTSLSRPVTSDEVEQSLRALKLALIAEHYGELAPQTAHKQWALSFRQPRLTSLHGSMRTVF